MGNEQSRECKDCFQEFAFTKQELRKSSRQLVSGARYVLPERCPSCREVHREQVKNMGRANFPVTAAESGAGCYGSLTAAQIQEAKSWASDLNLDQYSQSPAGSNCIAFKVDYKIAGLCQFSEGGNGLTIEAIRYAPWVSDYSGAEQALQSYVISESIRRGHGGTVFGAEKAFESSLEAAIFSLVQDRVTVESIAELAKRNNNGSADISWIAGMVAKQKISVPMLAHLLSYRNISLIQLQKLATDERSISRKATKDMQIKLKGLLGERYVARRMQSFGQAKSITYQADRGIKVDVVLKFDAKTSIKGLRFDSRTNALSKVKTRIQPGAEVALEVKTYSSSSFYPSERLSEMVREISSMPVENKFLVVTEDFNQLGENKQTEIVYHITEAGGSVYVLDGFSAQATGRAAGNFMNNLK